MTSKADEANGTAWVQAFTVPFRTETAEAIRRSAKSEGMTPEQWIRQGMLYGMNRDGLLGSDDMAAEATLTRCLEEHGGSVDAFVGNHSATPRGR